MTDEQRLIERLQLIEALFAGAATPGEREAAAQARERIRARLQQQQQTDPPVEYTFTLRDRWSHKLLIALMRRYGIQPTVIRGSATRPSWHACRISSWVKPCGRSFGN